MPGFAAVKPRERRERMTLDLSLSLPRRRGRRRAARRILTRLPGRRNRSWRRRPFGLAGLAAVGAFGAIAARKLTGRGDDAAWPETPAPPPDPHSAEMVDSTSTGDTPEGARSK